MLYLGCGTQRPKYGMSQEIRYGWQPCCHVYSQRSSLLLVHIKMCMLRACFLCVTYRDVFWQGTCDDGCYHLADKLGWKVSYFNLVLIEWRNYCTINFHCHHR